MSIIPNYEAGYNNLLSYVKPLGELIIGDMQLASGLLSVFNPLTIFMARKFGGSNKGHKNSMDIQSYMMRDLTKLKKKTYFLGSYYYCIGTKQ